MSLKSEQQGLLSNIQEDKEWLAQKAQEWAAEDPNGCCPACFTGYDWYQVKDRLKRRVERLNSINFKLFYQANEPGTPPKPMKVDYDY